MNPLFHFNLEILDTTGILGTFHEIPVYHPNESYFTHLFDYLFFDDPILKNSNTLTLSISIKFPTFFPDRQYHVKSFLLHLFAYLNSCFYFCCTNITLNPSYDLVEPTSSPGTLHHLEEILRTISQNLNQYQTFDSYFIYHVNFSYTRFRRRIPSKAPQNIPEIPF